MKTRKRLPIGIQTFREIREDDCYYVDKTPFALLLVNQGKSYFLSRPRRFGKSLFLDTLKELFEGNQALFKGLYADTRWNWQVKYPVIKISFAFCIESKRDWGTGPFSVKLKPTTFLMPTEAKSSCAKITELSGSSLDMGRIIT